MPVRRVSQSDLQWDQTREEALLSNLILLYTLPKVQSSQHRFFCLFVPKVFNGVNDFKATLSAYQYHTNSFMQWNHSDLATQRYLFKFKFELSWEDLTLQARWRQYCSLIRKQLIVQPFLSNAWPISGNRRRKQKKYKAAKEAIRSKSLAINFIISMNPVLKFQMPFHFISTTEGTFPYIYRWKLLFYVYVRRSKCPSMVIGFPLYELIEIWTTFMSLFMTFYAKTNGVFPVSTWNAFESIVVRTKRTHSAGLKQDV